MTSSNYALLTGIADLAILACTTAMLLFVLSRGMLRSKWLPNSGRILILAGIALIAAVHIVDLVMLALQTGELPDRDPHLLSSLIPDWLHWLLSRAAFSMIAVGLLIAFLQRQRAEERIERQSAITASAKETVIESERRFRNLIETTSDGVYCFTYEPPLPLSLPLDEQVRRSHEAILTECNEAFARNAFNRSPEDCIGMRMGVLDSNRDSEAHRAFIEALSNNGYRISDYELNFRTSDGAERTISLSITGVIRDGALLRFWGSESNITDIRRTEAALERRHGFQDLLARVSSAFVVTRDEDADKVIQDCVREVCQFIGAERSTLVWFDWDKREGDVRYSWTFDADHVVPPSVTIADYPNLAAALTEGEVSRVDDVSQMPPEMSRDQSALTELGIRAFLSLPLTIAGEVFGVMTFSNVSARREWSDQDVMDLKVFAELFANYMLRLRSRRDLDSALADLRVVSERLEAENVYLREEIEVTHDFKDIIGESDGILRCLNLVERVADTRTPVLILGETGTGKELVARAIHDKSSRRDRPLVKVNCAALPSDLIESVLFGYEQGAFTGAVNAKRGRFDLADGSTLFLDEVGEIPIELQAKLLRVLQEGEFERLGGSSTVSVDVRIIAATNRDLEFAVRAGEFRSDLYYRINTFPITLPPLRQRRSDIRLLAEHFVKVHAQHLGRQIDAISAEMMRQLCEYNWPGNVRELEGVIQRAIISSTDAVLELADPLIGEDDDQAPRVIGSSAEQLRIVERDHIIAVLEEAGWRISGEQGAAARLGLPPSTLRSKMKKLAIVRPH